MTDFLSNEFWFLVICYAVAGIILTPFYEDFGYDAKVWFRLTWPMLWPFAANFSRLVRLSGLILTRTLEIGFFLGIVASIAFSIYTQLFEVMDFKDALGWVGMLWLAIGGPIVLIIGYVTWVAEMAEKIFRD